MEVKQDERSTVDLIFRKAYLASDPIKEDAFQVIQEVVI